MVYGLIGSTSKSYGLLTRRTKLRHAIIPDVQAKPNVPLDHLDWCGKWLADKKPDVIVCLGDFADMESLSSYDVGKKSFEGRRYTKDIEVARRAMDILMAPILEEQEKIRRHKSRMWRPRLVLTLGNHETRINKAVDNDSKLEGLIKISDLGYDRYGWEIYPYLQVIVIDGICYSHYFTSGILGRPVTSARMLLQKHHMSCIAGHQQGRDIAYGKRADGSSMTSIISGSFYQHDEAYLNAQTNEHWHGCWMLNEVKDGSFDEMPLSINYLKRKYGN